MLSAAERLRDAVVQGNLAITKRLLARFPDLWLNTDPDNHGWCNLHYASYHGHYLVCFHLVSTMRRSSDRVCDIDLVTFDNLTVLHMPLFHHHAQTLHFLLQEFCTPFWINYKGGPLLRTPLHTCCAHDFVEGLKLLLEYGADWSIRDANGDSVFHVCFAHGAGACLEQLVKYVAMQHVAARVGPGKTPVLLDDMRVLALAELDALESSLNSNNCLPLSCAVSFEFERNYARLRKQWVFLAIDAEFLLRSDPNWDASLSLLEYFPGQTRAPLDPSASLSTLNVSLQPQVSSDSDLTRSSLDADNLAHAFFEPVSAANLPGTKVPARKHLRSLPVHADSDELAAVQRPPAPRRHSKSFAFSNRSSHSSARSLNATALPSSPLMVNFTRTLTRKSSYMSPQMPKPLTKSSSVDGMNALAAMENLNFDTAKSSAVATPTSTSSVNQFYFSPLNTRRKSTNNSTLSIESRGSSDDGKRASPARHKNETMKRNASLPTVPLAQLYTPDIAPISKLSRRPSVASLAKKPSLTQLSIPENHSDSAVKILDIPALRSTNPVETDPKLSHTFTMKLAQLSPVLKHPSPTREDKIAEEDLQEPRTIRNISFTRVR